MNEYFRWWYQWFRDTVLVIPGRVIAFIFFAFLFLVPLVTTHPTLLRILILAAIFAIYAASWDVLAGFTGQLNLGHALFFGVGAYTAGLLNLHFDLPPWVTIPLAGACAVVVGMIAGMPALRLRGFYLALVTLAFPIILTGVIFAFPDFSGGELGLYGISHLSDCRTSDYYIIVLIMVCSVVVMYKFTDARSRSIRTGVMLHAVREDEIAARASGVDTTRYKILAFAVSGFFGGIAGGIYAHFMRVVGPSTLDIFFSFQAIIWTVFGGIATIYGPVAGVYILYPLTELLGTDAFGQQIRFAVLALLMIFILLFMPDGIAVWIRDKIEVKCPRCKLVNVATRQYCRACRAPLYLEKTKSTGKKEEGENETEIHL